MRPTMSFSGMVRVDRRLRHRVSFSAAVCLVLSLLSGYSRGEDALGRAVPSDVSLYVHYRLDPDGLLGRELSHVAAAVSESGFLREFVVRLAISRYAPETRGERRRFERQLERWWGKAEAIGLWRLLSQEVILAVRGEGPLREYLAGFKIRPQDHEEIAAAFRDLLYVICSLSPELEISQSVRGGEQIMVIESVVGDESLCLAVREDKLLVATTKGLLRHSLQLLDGEGSDIAYPFTGRHAANHGKLSSIAWAGEYLEVHVEPRKGFPDIPFLGGLQSFLLGASVAGKVIDYEYHLRFAGEAEPERSLPAGREDGGAQGAAELLRRAGLEGAALSGWSELVPEGVSSFFVAGGGDLKALLGCLQEFCVEIVPFGKDVAQGLRATDLPRQQEALEALSPFLTGRRTVLHSAEGFALLLEIRGSRADMLAVWTRLDRPLQALGLDPRAETAKDLFAGPGPAVEGVRSLALTAFTERRVLTGIAGDFLFVATAPDLVRKAVLPEAGKADVDDVLRHLPSGDLRAVSRTHPPLAISVLRLGLPALSLLGKALPETSQNAVSKSILESTARLRGVVDALGFLESDVSCAARSGSSVEGRGRLVLEPEEE